jgi:hypothetical protein
VWDQVDGLLWVRCEWHWLEDITVFYTAPDLNRARWESKLACPCPWKAGCTQSCIQLKEHSRLALHFLGRLSSCLSFDPRNRSYHVGILASIDRSKRLGRGGTWIACSIYQAGRFWKDKDRSSNNWKSLAITYFSSSLVDDGWPRNDLQEQSRLSVTCHED